jgi:hypothetical protein
LDSLQKYSWSYFGQIFPTSGSFRSDERSSDLALQSPARSRGAGHRKPALKRVWGQMVKSGGLF